MPVLRERLLEGGAPVDFVMAWVSIPALTVERSDQRYEPVGPGRVRYVSLDGDDFKAELELRRGRPREVSIRIWPSGSPGYPRHRR